MTVAEGYIERSRARMLDQMKRLTTSNRKEESKVEVSFKIYILSKNIEKIVMHT